MALPAGEGIHVQHFPVLAARFFGRGRKSVHGARHFGFREGDGLAGFRDNRLGEFRATLLDATGDCRQHRRTLMGRLIADLDEGLLGRAQGRFDGGLVAEWDAREKFARGRVDHVLRGTGFVPFATDPEPRKLHAY